MKEPRRTRLRCKDVVQKNVDQKQNHEGLTLTPDNIMTHFPPSIWPLKYGNALNCWNLENSHLQKDPRHLFWEPVQQQATSSIVSLHVGSAMDKSWPKLYLSCNLTDPFLYIQGEYLVQCCQFKIIWLGMAPDNAQFVQHGTHAHKDCKPCHGCPSSLT